MFGLLFGGGSKKTDTYSYHMVIHVDGEPRNKVRDVRGEFTSDEGSIEQVKAKIVAGCREQLGADVFMVSFSYK